ncbi:MAG: LPS export ABC transporter periplasmic protein LptC, partial [Cyanobacteria bacterium MAG COS3_bin_20]|nr:LPS export ABC transporter periplasmic protein LptC [Cyanobacteria bacterium MAG COS3_bin_20]
MFQQDTEVLEFKGATQLNRVDGTNSASTVVRGGHGTWNLKSGLFQAPGPVQAIRSDGRTLSASGLDGNTRQGYLDLQQPVTLVLESDRGRITAGRTRWLFSAEQLESDQPIQAELKNSKVQGRGFKLDQRTGTVIISNSCRVEQTLETLRAQRCAWNWRSERVVADGDVVLQRTEPE